MTDLLTVFSAQEIKIVVLLIVLDVVLGVVGAVMKKEFVLGKLAGFMKKGVLAYVFGLAVVALVAKAQPSLAIVSTVAYWLVVGALAGSILDNLAKLGIPLPKILRK